MPSPTIPGGKLAVTIGSLTYMVEPSPSKEVFDRKEQKLELANGTRFNTVDYYDGDSECKATIQKPLCDLDDALFTLCGLGATVTDPTATTIIYALPTRTTTITNALCSTVTINVSRGKPIGMTVEFLSTSPPVESAGYGSTPPVFSQPNFLYFKDITSFFTIGTTGVIGFADFQLKIAHNLDPYYGVRTDGLTLPTSLTPTSVDVDGTFRKLITDDADYKKFLVPCQTPGDIGIVAQSFCDATSPKVFTLTAKSCIYGAPQREGDIRKAFEETFKYMSKCIGGANPLVCTML